MKRNEGRRSISQFRKREKVLFVLWILFAISLAIDMIYVNITSLMYHCPPKYLLWFREFNWLSVAFGVVDLILGIAIFILTKLDLNELSDSIVSETTDWTNFKWKLLSKAGAAFVITISVMSIATDVIKFFS